ncbi:extradiol dioxygenase [Brevibacillus choshinensis]|uniref:Extradiol dioxygenase n=1 Tax=Brevibacillus choshinensis TaxID=54911 RepID=A0ABR5NCY2_BRECH|nr:VOC family protein [Brevibacillus choshinensis]KQL49425.1 extradiol dioxygenase [Brevibacillus choshinensis]
MTKEIWLNLPVKDVQKSKQFFTEIGFSLNPRFGDNDQQASLFIGEKQFVVMLFPESTFTQFTRNEIPDATKATQILISIDAQSKEDVDSLLDKVVTAGGTIYAKPQDQGWMYGAGFADLDGHRWNVLFMDESKIASE